MRTQPCSDCQIMQNSLDSRAKQHSQNIHAAILARRLEVPFKIFGVISHINWFKLSLLFYVKPSRHRSHLQYRFYYLEVRCNCIWKTSGYSLLSAIHTTSLQWIFIYWTVMKICSPNSFIHIFYTLQYVLHGLYRVTLTNIYNIHIYI